MKRYESACSSVLSPRQPVIIRVDGKAFHTYTRGLERPWDLRFIEAMDCVAKKLCEEIQGAQFAYVQSDEVSVLVHGYKKFNTCPWFDNKVQKMVSVAASIASTMMTVESSNIFARAVMSPEYSGETRPAHFDARVFTLPEADVTNYFLWRQQDAIRNSIQMLARSLYSHKQCDHKDQEQLREMCLDADSPWSLQHVHLRRGRVIVKKPYQWHAPNCPEAVTRYNWQVNEKTPEFNVEREFVEQFLELEEE